MGNKIAATITRVSKNSPKNNSERRRRRNKIKKEKYLEKDIYLQNKDRKLLMT